MREAREYWSPLNPQPRRCIWRTDADISKPQCEGKVNALHRQSVCCDSHTIAWSYLPKQKKAALKASAASDAAHAAVRAR